MLQRTLFYSALGLLMMVGMAGCSIMRSGSGSSATLPSSAFFPIDTGELKPLQAIAHAQDSRMKNCHKGPACEEAYYTRGLVALFENRADAITVFQELHTAMPNSRYDPATIGWLNLLQDPAPSSVYSKALLVQLKQEVLHNLMERADPTIVRNAKDHDRRVAELNR